MCAEALLFGAVLAMGFDASCCVGIWPSYWARLLQVEGGLASRVSWLRLFEWIGSSGPCRPTIPDRQSELH